MNNGNLRPFRPGQVSNPHGRRSDKALVQVVLRETRGGRELGEILIRIARTAPRMKDRVEACRVLLDRVFGKPAERLELEQQSSGRFTLADVQVARDLLREQLQLRDQERRKAAEPETVIEATASAEPASADPEPAQPKRLTMGDLEEARRQAGLVNGAKKAE